MRVAFEHEQLDSETRTLERKGWRLAVEPTVFDLLVYLIEQRARVVSGQELLDSVWPGVSVGPAARTAERATRVKRTALGMAWFNSEPRDISKHTAPGEPRQGCWW